MKNKVYKINGFVYVTSEEKIKDWDWILRNGELPIKVTKNFFWDFGDRYYKIILTNDYSLTIVQQLTPQDVEYLNTVDECEVLPFLSNNGIVLYGYKLQLPKQETKQLTDLEVAIKLEQVEREERKQETIEEAANNYANNFIDGKDHYYGFIEGYNHAIKTLYSEEEVLGVIQYLSMNEEFREYSSVSIKTAKFFLEEWFNQNKKK